MLDGVVVCRMVMDKLRIFNKPIELNTVFFVFLFITGTFCIVFEPGFGQRIAAEFNLFFDLYILCAFLALLPEKIRRAVRMALYIILYVVALVDIVCYVRIDAPITPVFIQLVEQTNTHEAGEALSSYLDPSLLFSKAGILLLIITANIIVANKNMLPKMKGNRLTGAAILTAFVICGIVSWTDIEYKYYRIVCQYDELKTQQIKDLTPKSKYYLPVYRLIYSVSENGRLHSTIQGLAKSVGKASVDSCSHTSPNIVLIIGESFNRHHSSLYGYNHPTTPYQVERERKGELIKFGDVISSWNVTCESFENMLSTWSEGDKGEWYQYPLFPEIFRKAGYRVEFISNQFVQNPKSSFSDFKEDIFINNETISKANFDVRNNALYKYDESLIDEYKKMRKGKYNLTIFHFINMHADFSQRFPARFRLFGADDYGYRKDLSADDRQILADYDNAVRYNDYVTDRILRLFDNTETVVVFLSDHGERVFDNSTEWGRNLTWNKNDIIQQFRIPMWIWCSRLYAEKHGNIVRQIEKAKDRRYMTDNLPQLMFHLAGISSKYYDVANDILSSSYNEGRKRIIRHEKDFDEIVK